MLPSYRERTTAPTLTEYISGYHGIPQDAVHEILTRNQREIAHANLYGDIVGWIADKILIKEGHRCTERCTEPEDD